MATLVIDAAGIFELLRNKRLCQRFPFLAGLRSLLKSRPAASSCGGCTQALTAVGVNPESVKQHIAGLSPAEKDEFKALLGVTQVRLAFRQGNQRKVVLF